jgi:hypothetical protein
VRMKGENELKGWFNKWSSPNLNTFEMLWIKRQMIKIMNLCDNCIGVTTSSTEFSFQNLVFFGIYLSFQWKKSLQKSISLPHILNPNLTKEIPWNRAHQDLSNNTTKGTFQFLWDFFKLRFDLIFNEEIIQYSRTFEEVIQYSRAFEEIHTIFKNFWRNRSRFKNFWRNHSIFKNFCTASPKVMEPKPIAPFTRRELSNDTKNTIWFSGSHN